MKFQTHIRFALAVLSGCLVLSPVASAQRTIVTEATDGVYDYQANFPSELSGIGFRMPRQDFVDFVTEKGWNYRTNADNTIFLVSVPDAPFTAIMVRMNSDAGTFLTEIEIQFPDEAAAQTYFKSSYQPLESTGNFYAFDPEKGYATKAWQFSNKVFYVATLANTRWSNQ